MTSLTRTEAAERAALLTVLDQHVTLDMTGLATGPRLRTVSRIRFASAKAGASTFLELVADQVLSATLNGSPIPVEATADGRIGLRNLQLDNEVIIESTTDQTEKLAGIQRSVDSDGLVYVWTSFEPADAARVFACFDQPDLKTTFTFRVLVPSGWLAVSNSGQATVTHTDGVDTFDFAATVPMSTYVTTVCAGPYYRIEREVDDHVLSLLCRQSLAQFLDRDADELFRLTADGLAFFGEQFAMPFPQREYAQVFCPDFGGAMENYGCVVWTDSMLFRSEPTTAQRELRAVILLHEMAHMWFGDIVTMRWWDDLWLNESFADWAAVWAAVAISEFTSGWATFLSGRKSTGYDADASVITHPISQPVSDVDAAMAAFDMITYAKGASVLKQLAAWVGIDNFVAGLRTYFAKFAWGNSELSDLLAELTATSGRDVAAWSRAWLLTAGTNTLTLETATSPDGALTNVAVRQTAPALHPQLRAHRVGLGVYDLDGSNLVLRQLLELDVDGELTAVPELVGEQAADLLLLNDADLAFARVRLDDRSTDTLLARGWELPDPTARALAAQIVGHAMDDGLLAADDTVAYLLPAMLAESDPASRDELLTRVSMAAVRWSAPTSRAALCSAACEAALTVAEGASTPAGRTSALQAAARTAITAEQVDRVVELSAGDNDLGWRTLIRRSALGLLPADQVEPAIAAALANDPDPDAGFRAHAVRGAQADVGAKEAAWKLAMVDRSIPIPLLNELGAAVLTPSYLDASGSSDPALAAAAAASSADHQTRFCEILPELGGSGMLAGFVLARAFFPWFGVDESFLERIRAAARQENVPPMIANQVLENADMLERVLRARRVPTRGLAGSPT